MTWRKPDSHYWQNVQWTIVIIFIQLFTLDTFSSNNIDKNMLSMHWRLSLTAFWAVHNFANIIDKKFIANALISLSLQCSCHWEQRKIRVVASVLSRGAQVMIIRSLLWQLLFYALLNCCTAYSSLFMLRFERLRYDIINVLHIKKKKKKQREPKRHTQKRRQIIRLSWNSLYTSFVFKETGSNL